MNYQNEIKHLKKDFTIMREIKHKIISSLKVIYDKIIISKEDYQTMIKKHKKKIFIFGLEPFNFQNKLFDIEYKHFNETFNLISNHLYGDYFNLFSLIKDYCRDNINDVDINKYLETMKHKYKKYDPINIYKPYTIEEINKLFDDIIQVILLLNKRLIQLNKQKDEYEIKLKSGFNINNFLFTFEHKIRILNEKILLYTNFMKILLNTQKKYLEQFIKRIEILLEQINEEFVLDDSSIYTDIANTQKDEIENNYSETNQDTEYVDDCNNKVLVNNNIVEENRENREKKDTDNNLDNYIIKQDIEKQDINNKI